jgi:hypothetical protein
MNRDWVAGALGVTEKDMYGKPVKDWMGLANEGFYNDTQKVLKPALIQYTAQRTPTGAMVVRPGQSCE